MSELMMAARIGDSIAHTEKASTGWAYFLGALAVAAYIVLAVVTLGASVAVTLAVVSILAIAVVAVGRLGEAEGAKHPVADQGNVMEGAATVFIGGLAATFASEEHKRLVQCKQHGPPQYVAQGSRTVFIEYGPATRVKDKTTCDGELEMGCPTVTIGGPPVTVLEITDEAWWLHVAEDIVDVIGMVAGLVGGITEIKGALFALENWRIGGYALSLLMSGAALTAKYGFHNEHLAHQIETAKLAVDIFLGGSEIYKNGAEVVEHGWGALGREAEDVPHGELPHGEVPHGEVPHGEVPEPRVDPNVTAPGATPPGESSILGPHGERIDHAGNPLPPENPPALVNSRGEPLNPTLPAQTPPSNGGSSLWYPGKPEPPGNVPPLIIP